MGSIERFLSIAIEHYAGAFPVWLSPVQVMILPITDKHNKWAEQVSQELKANNIRVELSLESETLGKKIRGAEKQKIPYLLVIGDKEVEAEAIAVRKRGGNDLGQIKLAEFIKNISEEIETKKP